MLTLLSPAKRLLDGHKPYTGLVSKPIFAAQTAELIKLMRSKSVEEIANLMNISSELAQLNYKRYQSFHLKNCPPSDCYPAIFLFQGDVYKGLEAETWQAKSVEYAQSHLAILSGLYGLLHPLDLIQPYRLEMGTSLANSSGKNLYDYWQNTITEELNKELTSHTNPVLINLASNEYFKAIDVNLLKFPLVHIHFLEQKNSQLKTIGIYAKKARGMMANYLMQNQIDNLDKLKKFNSSDYAFCSKSSDQHNFNFIRVH